MGRCCEEGARGCDYTWPYTRIFEIECVHVKYVSLLVICELVGFAGAVIANTLSLLKIKMICFP